MFWSGLVASGGTRNVGFHFLRAAGEILSKKKQRGELKKGLKREIHEEVAHQTLHICFHFPATIPETKSEQSH